MKRRQLTEKSKILWKIRRIKIKNLTNSTSSTMVKKSLLLLSKTCKSQIWWMAKRKSTSLKSTISLRRSIQTSSLILVEPNRYQQLKNSPMRVIGKGLIRLTTLWISGPTCSPKRLGGLLVLLISSPSFLMAQGSNSLQTWIFKKALSIIWIETLQ